MAGRVPGPSGRRARLPAARAREARRLAARSRPVEEEGPPDLGSGRFPRGQAALPNRRSTTSRPQPVGMKLHLDPWDLRRLALAAFADERTVRRYLADPSTVKPSR